MIKENIKFCDTITEAIVKQLEERNLSNFVTLFPMLRKENDKLLLGTLVEINNNELIKKGCITRPRYWVIIDNDNYQIIELNKTEEKDYMDTSIIPLDKEFEDNFVKVKKELGEYETAKRIEYQKYLTENIKTDILNGHNEILDAINNTLIINNSKVNAEEYLVSNIEEEIEEQVNDLVSIIINQKYSAIIYYYQTIIEEILNEYKDTGIINLEKMKLAATILDKYYGDAYGIKYFFNID